MDLIRRSLLEQTVVCLRKCLRITEANWEPYFVTVTLEIVVESELSSSLYVLQGKKTNGKLAMDKPFLRLAIRLTRMIDETPQSSLHTPA